MSASKFMAAILLSVALLLHAACTRYVRVDADVADIELVQPATHYDGWGARKLGYAPGVIEIDTYERQIAGWKDGKIMWLRIPAGVEEFQFAWTPSEPTLIDAGRLKRSAEIGMTQDEVIHVLGRPARRSTTNTPHGKHESWIYVNEYDKLALPEYVVSFRDGKVNGTHKPSQ